MLDSQNQLTTDWDEVESCLNRAVERLESLDGYLLENRHHEQSISHRLAVYLEQEFPDWYVDCEYNRAGGGSDPKRGPDGQPNIPDIIVHQRGQYGPNLLAIEIKPSSKPESEQNTDRNKLRGYLSGHAYSYAVFLTYDAEGFDPVERIEEA